jgi:predicted Zn-dependent protease
MRTRAALLSLVLAAGAFSGCTTNPATGKKIFTLGMTRDQEVALGEQSAPQFTQQYGGKVESPALQQYVTGIGLKMAKETEAQNPSLPWEFTLLNTDVVNAFALPGGKVFFTRALAEKLTTEAQMAGVIGHEIGHVTAEHAAQRIASSTAIEAGVAATAAVVSGSSNTRVQQLGGYGVPALSMGSQLVQLKFGRNEELEADRLGMRYMSNVGYNPRGQLEVMQVLKSLGASGTPEILNTHPDPDARIAQVQQLLNTQYASMVNNPQYQDYKERYQTQFLSVIHRLPPAPKQQQQGRIDMNDPTTWCAVCRAAHAPVADASSVPPREGIYAFFAPPTP